MKIKEVMTNPAVVIYENMTIEDTAKVMRRYNIGALPVVNEKNELTGIITDRDIVIRSIAKGFDSKAHKVYEIMTHNVIITSPDTEIKNATYIMSKDKIRRLPVVDGKHVVGVVALGDFAVCNDYLSETGEALCEISEGCQKTISQNT